MRELVTMVQIRGKAVYLPMVKVCRQVETEVVLSRMQCLKSDANDISSTYIYM